ncbi:MAG: hypothetical protein QXN49_07250 [Archaeoglobaceae archaeon]
MKRLGKGLDAIIGEVKSEEVRAEEVKREEIISEKVRSDEVRIDSEILRRVIDESRRNPRVTLWSVKCSAVLRILRKTTPEFSISEVAAEILEEGLRRRYPEIWKAVENEIGEL